MWNVQHRCVHQFHSTVKHTSVSARLSKRFAARSLVTDGSEQGISFRILLGCRGLPSICLFYV